MKRYGLHFWIRASGGIFKRPHYWIKPSIKELVAAAAYRYCRMNKDLSVAAWHAAVTSFAERISGNATVTIASLRVCPEWSEPHYGRKTPIYQFDDEGKCVGAYPRMTWAIVRRDVMDRYKAWEDKRRLRLACRYRNTCNICGLVDPVVTLFLKEVHSMSVEAARYAASGLVPDTPTGKLVRVRRFPRAVSEKGMPVGPMELRKMMNSPLCERCSRRVRGMLRHWNDARSIMNAAEELKETMRKQQEALG